MPTNPRLLRHQLNNEIEKIRDAAHKAGDAVLASMLTIVIQSGCADAPPNFQRKLYSVMLETYDVACAEKGKR